jgi:hypothetical protein
MSGFVRIKTMNKQYQPQNASPVIPQSPPNVTLNTPQQINTPIGSEAIPSSEISSEPSVIVSEMKKATNSRIIPPPEASECEKDD